MASLNELKKTLPAHYTLSNKNLILIAHVRDETVFFYDELGPNTTIVLLAQPRCYGLKKIFLEFMNDLGTTVIDIREDETFDPKYVIKNRSKQIIKKLLEENTFEKIITHPRYKINNDPQNRVLYDIVSEIVKVTGSNNHYTYNKIEKSEKPKKPCGIKKGILEIYSKVLDSENKINKKDYTNYSNITSYISGIRKIK